MKDFEKAMLDMKCKIADYKLDVENYSRFIKKLEDKINNGILVDEDGKDLRETLKMFKKEVENLKQQHNELLVKYKKTINASKSFDDGEW